MDSISSPFDSQNLVSGSLSNSSIFAESQATPFNNILPSFRTSSASLANNSPWSRGVGGTRADQGLSIAFDSTGNVYTTGVFSGSVDLDGNGTLEASVVDSLRTPTQDIFVIKQSADGSVAWARQIGGAGTEQGGKLAVDAGGNVYVTGSFSDTLNFNGNPALNLTSAGNSRDAFIIKYDTSGTPVWSRSIGATGSDEGIGIAVDANGNVYATGSFTGNVNLDSNTTTSELTTAGGQDAFIIKYNTSGEFNWARSIGGTSNTDSGQDIAVDNSGNVYAIGNFTGRIDLNRDASAVVNTTGSDAYIAKYSNDGAVTWIRQVGNANAFSTVIGSGIAIDDSGNVYTTGNFQGSVDLNKDSRSETSLGSNDVFVVKRDSEGTVIWGRRIGDTLNDLGRDIAVDGSENVYLTGSFTNRLNLSSDGVPGLTSAGIGDAFIIKLNPDASVNWSRSIGGTEADEGRGIAVDDRGNIYTTGLFRRRVDINKDGTVDLISASDASFTDAGDAFIVKQRDTNTAPILDASKSPILNSVDAGSTAPVSGTQAGTLVSKLVDLTNPTGELDNVTDDASSLTGIAITKINSVAADTTEMGRWYYSIDNGTSWKEFPTDISENNALLLNASARIYFQPNAGVTGNIDNAISFRAWDTTSGTNGGRANTFGRRNGGATAFSTEIDTAPITVNVVNTINTVPAAVQTNEDTPIVFSTANNNAITIRDLNPSTVGVTVNLEADKGIFTAVKQGEATVTENNQKTITITGSFADVNATLNGLVFTPDKDFNTGIATTTTTVNPTTIKVTSKYSENVGSVEDIDTINVTVNPVNDAPVNKIPGEFTNTQPITIGEDKTVIPVSSPITVSDFTGKIKNIRVTLDGLSHPKADELDILLVGPNERAVMLMSDAGNGGLNNVTLNFADDAVNGLTTFSNITSGTYRPINIGSQDSFDSSVSPGPYSYSLSDFRDIDPNGEWKLYIVDDSILDGGQLANGWSLYIDTGNINTNEDTPLEFSQTPGNQISLEDKDAGNNPVEVTLSITNGTLSLGQITNLNFTTGDGTADSTMTFTGTVTDIKKALERLRFNPNQNFNGVANLEITTKDQGATGLVNNPESDTNVIYITVNPDNDLPSITKSVFSIAEGETITLTNENFSSSDVESDSANLAYSVTNVTNGRFELASQAGQPIDKFTQAQINAGQVKFVHNGSEDSPSYDITLSDGTDTTNSRTIKIKEFTKRNDIPVLVKNTLTIIEGGILSLTSENLQATDEETEAFNLTFNVSEVSFGKFVLITRPTEAVTSFTQSDIIQGQVRFVHDGSQNKPSFSIVVNDGDASSTDIFANIEYDESNDLPVLVNNTFNITEGGSLVLSDTNISATDEESEASLIVFAVSNVVGGQFELISQPGQAIIRFTQAEINQGFIKFVHDGGENPPSYKISISDSSGGEISGNYQVGEFTRENDAPRLANNSFSFTEGGTTIITTANLSATDVDSLDSSITFTISDAVNGNFELIAEPGRAVTSFTQEDITQSRVRFVHNGAETPPSFQISVGDGQASTDAVASVITAFSPNNDAPVNTVPTAAQSVLEERGLVFSLANNNAISIGDDAGDNPIQVTLAAADGILMVANNDTALTITDNGTGALKIRGTTAKINAVLDGLIFRSARNFNGSTTILVTADDLGNTGVANGPGLVTRSTINVNVEALGEKYDFDGDGFADILWRKPSTGENAIWKLNQFVVEGNFLEKLPGADWKMITGGDFNGDRKGDILWRNYQTGENVIWLMDGFERLNSESEQFITEIDDVNWKMITAADFNGDGKDDILWRNYETGENAVWFMDGLTVDAKFFENRTVNGQLQVLRTISTDWSMVGAGDVDGDGKADIVWRNNVTGDNAVWLMNGERLKDGKFITSQSDSNWRIETIGDLNGDGKAEIIWRHLTSDENAVWFVDVNKIEGQNFFVDIKLIADGRSDVLKPGLSWRIEAAVDYNGDGKDDLLWRNTNDGRNAVWYMNGFILSRGEFLTLNDSILEIDTGWEISFS